MSKKALTFPPRSGGFMAVAASKQISDVTKRRFPPRLSTVGMYLRMLPLRRHGALLSLPISHRKTQALKMLANPHKFLQPFRVMVW